MEFDVYWLLALPVVFALGWLAARHEFRARVARPSLPDAYFRGLNFLLNDQSDRAVDAFVDVVRIDPETIELHFALGKLFRRRGETDRAIRVHQNLLDRSDIDPALREQALFELAQDFLKAGLLDRADQAFERLAAGGQYLDAALRHRIDIAEMMRDWPRAIELASLQAPIDRRNHDRLRLAHFHCEEADRLLSALRSVPIGASADADRIRAHLDQAQHEMAGTGHPRVALLRGELAEFESRFAEALSAWDLLRRSQSSHFNLIVARWVQAHGRLGRIAEAIEGLSEQWRRQPTTEVFLQLFEALRGREGDERAAAWAIEALKDHPSLAGLAGVIARRMQAGPSQSDETILSLAGDLLTAQARLQSPHLCTQCGFRARQYYWQCPGCARWDTVSPLRAEDQNP